MSGLWTEDKYIIQSMELGLMVTFKDAKPEEIKTSIFTVYETGYYFYDLVNKSVTKDCSKTHMKSVCWINTSDKLLKIGYRNQQLMKLQFDFRGRGAERNHYPRNEGWLNKARMPW